MEEVMKELFIYLFYVIEKLEIVGYEVYFVGGVVRDFILNWMIGDIDIVMLVRFE